MRFETGLKSLTAASTWCRDHRERVMEERTAFIAMRLFLEEYYKRSGNDLETLLADLSIEADGMPLDPAAWDDWINSLKKAASERQ